MRDRRGDVVYRLSGFIGGLDFCMLFSCKCPIRFDWTTAFVSEGLFWGAGAPSPNIFVDYSLICYYVLYDYVMFRFVNFE